MQFRVLEGLAQIEIHNGIKVIYGDDSMYVKNTQQFIGQTKRFSRENMNIFDEQRAICKLCEV